MKGKSVRGIIALLLLLAVTPLSCGGAISLNNYPKLFDEDAMIIVGENASQVELEDAQEIAAKLEELTGNEPLVKNETTLTEADKAGYNLIIIGTPESNKVLEQVYNLTNATRVTQDYPGEYKGVLEVLGNPWNENKTLLVIAGSDKFGVEAGSCILQERKELKDKVKVLTDWEEYTGVDLPIDTEEEAIKYAEADPSVKKFVKKWSAEGYNIKAYAEFLTGRNIWDVTFHVVAEVEEIWFFLGINPNGTIVHKGGVL